jgi:hypothetical protein
MRESCGRFNLRRETSITSRPLVYETTGGFGKEAKKWFKKVQLEFRKINGDSFGTLGVLGYDHTWSANSFTQWWTQRFAMTTTSHVAACAWQAGFTPARDRWSCPPWSSQAGCFQHAGIQQG